MSGGWTEKFLNHYSRYLGEPSKVLPFSVSDDLPAIRILVYEKVISGCVVFATLGLCEYMGEAGEISEVICPVDHGFKDAPSILAHSLYRLVAKQPYHPVRGVSIGGIGDANPEFIKRYCKHAIYLTDPFGLDNDFPFVLGDADIEGRVFLAMFITQNEFDFLNAEGCEQLEDKFEEKCVDPYEIRRKSCV